MPSGFYFTVLTDYKLTCYAGCTATALSPSTSADNTNQKLTFRSVFPAYIAVNTIVDLKIEGWQNPSDESLLQVKFATIWDSTDYWIE